MWLLVTYVQTGLLYSPCTARKIKFSIKDFFSKCDKIRRKPRIWSHLLKKSLMEKLHFLYSYVFEISNLWPLRARFNLYTKVPNKRGGGVLISRGLEICVKYNKRGVWNIRGGRKRVNRVPFRLV